MAATAAAPESITHALPRAMGLRDVVLFNIVAILSLRWLATAAAAGPSSISLWILAGLLFFIPQGMAVSHLAARYPNEGGIYFWTKQAFGEGHGFLCGWCYWVNNILYYPNLLMSTAVVGTYAFGRGGSGLEGDWSYVLPATLGALWLAVGLNIVGLRTGRWLQNLGAVGTYLPGVLLISLGLYAAMTRPPATPLTMDTIVPDLGDWSSLNLWASIAFAFAGLELCAVLGDEVRDPRRTLPRSILISAPLIAFLYIAGTVALLWLMPSGEVNIVSGFLQAIAVGAGDAGVAVAWLAPAAAALYVIGNVGGVGAWLAGPARVAFVIGLDRYFPEAFGKIHPRWKTPYIVILTQAVLASLFMVVSVLGHGTTVEKAYLVILDTMLLVYFIPYIYLFVCYLSDRWTTKSPSGTPASRFRAALIGLSGLGLTLLAMLIATVPPSGTEEPWLFRVKVIGGAGAFVVMGIAIFLRGRR